MSNVRNVSFSIYTEMCKKAVVRMVCFERKQTPDLTSLFNITRDVLIVGDLSAHDPRRQSQKQMSSATN